MKKGYSGGSTTQVLPRQPVKKTSEKNPVDEEVTSEEDYEDNVERTMFTMALVRSVVEKNDEGNRYGLRKTRKRTGHDLERLEHNQATNEGGLAKKTEKLEISETSTVPNPLKSLPRDDDEHEAASGDDVDEESNKHEVPSHVDENAIADEIVSTAVASARDDSTADANVAEGGRQRGYSIDLDSLLELNTPMLEQTGGRNRAFSFECFTFGINPDEQLPPLSISHPTETVHSGNRMRGDSIIFDPSSFRDGGIHEQNALIHAEGEKKKPIELPLPPPMTSTTHVGSIAQPTSENPENFSMELLNKGGRIGMYLPEARRARIARFHAKRAKRIWRKRIKYDCRKKLADSRPRVKGRFVKRADMK